MTMKLNKSETIIYLIAIVSKDYELNDVILFTMNVMLKFMLYYANYLLN